MRTEAEKKAKKKDKKKELTDGTKKQVDATLDINDYDIIDNYCKNSGMSKAQLIVIACKEYIKNNAL